MKLLNVNAKVMFQGPVVRPIKQVRTKGGYSIRPIPHACQIAANILKLATNLPKTKGPSAKTKEPPSAKMKLLKKQITIEEDPKWRNKLKKVQKFLFTEKPGLKITLDSKEQIDFLKLFLRQAYHFNDFENKSARSS